MKKIIIVLMICIAIVGSVYFTQNSDFNLIDKIIDLIDKSGDKYEAYSNDFKINELQLKNATFHYDKLTKNQKIIYSNIAMSVKELNSKRKLVNYSETDETTIKQDISIAINSFLKDHPEVFYIKPSYSIISERYLTNTVTYIEIFYTVENMEELNTKILAIKDSLKEYDTKLTDKFEIERFLHDKLATQVKNYKNNIDDSIPDVYHSIEGSLLKKEAVCDGISKAMQLLLDRNNIESILIEGKLEDVAHAWLLVNIYDQWYHLDVTSDKYVKNDFKYTIAPAHTYFNVTTDFIKTTHSINNEENYPICDSNTYNYFNYLDYSITEKDNFEYKLKKIVEKQKDNNYLEFYCNQNIDIPKETLDVLYSINYNGYKTYNSNINMNYYVKNGIYIITK